MLFFCNYSSSQEGYEANVPDGFYGFITEFTNAVKAHDYKVIYKLLEKEYRKDQLKFLGGNRQQLIDDLFGGFNEAEEWVNAKLDEIQEIWMFEFEETTTNNFKLSFEVELEHNILTVELLLTTSDNRKKWGIIGASG